MPLTASLAGARRVDHLKVIPSLVSLTKQERRRAYRRKLYTRLKSPPFQCGPPAVEPQYINLQSSFTDCESNFTDNPLLTSSKEGGDMDFDDSIDSVVATDSNSNYNIASDIDPISFLRNPGLQPQSYRQLLQLQYRLYASFLHENLSNVLFKILIA